MNSLLNKPYPFLDNSSSSAIFKVAIVGTFITFFLYFFNNENNSEPLHIFLEEGFFIALLQFIFLFSLPKLFLKSHNLRLVPLWQYIAWLTLFTLICYVFIYMYLQLRYYKEPVSLRGFKCFCKVEYPSGLIIVFVIICLDYMFLLRKEINTIKALNDQFESKKEEHSHETISKSETNFQRIDETNLDCTIYDEQKKNFIAINRSKLLFVKGADNYVEIFYVNDKNTLSKELLRNTLNAIETDKTNNFLFRVHRSYLCNLSNVVHISGNSKGYVLHFTETGETIPVSRTKSDEIIDRFRQILKK